MNHNIYFGASIRAGRDDAEIYSQIINHLKQYGKVLTEHIGNKSLSNQGEKLADEAIHDRDIELLLSSDVAVFEVSTPSLGVGKEIGKAEDSAKPVLCLYRPQEGKKLSAMIAGSKQIVNKNYANFEDAKKSIDEFFVKLPFA